MKVRVTFMLLVLLIANISIISELDVSNAGTTNLNNLNVVHAPSPRGNPSIFSWKHGFTYITQERSINIKDSLILRYAIKKWWNEKAIKVEWYQIFQGKSPQLLGTGFNQFTVNNKEIGNNYYQIVFICNQYGIFSSTTKKYYSDIISIHINKESENLSGILTSLNDSYLNSFNGYPSSTTAVGTIYPAGADAVIKWSCDKPEIATIDSDTGIITANNKGKSGIVTITGTPVVGNKEYSDFSETQQLSVGLGLDDQETEEFGSATFQIQGGWIKQAHQIKWFKTYLNLRSPSKNKTIELTNEHKEYLTLNNVNKSEDKKYVVYHAEFKVNFLNDFGKTVTKTFKTNNAGINVNPSNKPRIKLKFNLINMTLKNLGINVLPKLHLRRVAPNDTIVMQGIVTDDNVNSFLKNGRLEFNVPINSKKLKVWVDGVLVNSNFDAEESTVSIDDLNFSKNKSFHIKVQYTINKFNNAEFKTTPKFRILDNAPDNINPESEVLGEPLEMDFVDDTLMPIGSNIHFTVNHASVDKSSAYGQIDDPNDEVLKIVDRRRDKFKAQVYVHLDNDTDSKTQPSFYYCPDHASPILLSSKWLKIYETQPNQSLKSIVWKKKIKVVIPKNYQATNNLQVPIRWEIRQVRKTDYDDLSNR